MICNLLFFAARWVCFSVQAGASASRISPEVAYLAGIAAVGVRSNSSSCWRRYAVAVPRRSLTPGSRSRARIRHGALTLIGGSRR